MKRLEKALNYGKFDKQLTITSEWLCMAILLITIACGIGTVVSQIGIFLSNLAIKLIFG
ncbi:hypothetical protein GCM10022297_01390 [Lactobacillus hamsteri]|uniref:hypothetical protein n=1 Tax=Lactobacillus hamsteri TaxID=96565 RepID=UPI000A92DFB0|nr:hypothetical protein [Lactobacillus hamsteri]